MAVVLSSVWARDVPLNTEPHEAEIGDEVLLFTSEVMGDEFLEYYERLREAQSVLGVAVNDLSQVESAKVRQVVAALRMFLARLMPPESAEKFARWDVVVGKKSVAMYHDPVEAAEDAAGGKNAHVVD